jgi:hypothetical protein
MCHNNSSYNTHMLQQQQPQHPHTMTTTAITPMHCNASSYDNSNTTHSAMPATTKPNMA